MEDFDILTTDGNIAFYKSCEVTELFLHRKKDKATFNFFTLVVYEEKPFHNSQEQYLSKKPIRIDDEYTLGLKRFWLSLEDSKKTFHALKNDNKWNSNGNDTSQFPDVRSLPKQYIPAIEGNRLTHILKNNFNSGSYILEFFDEAKTNVSFLLKMEVLGKLNNLSEDLKKYVPIDLSVVRDRIGNFIFQFPITILNSDSKALSTWDGVELYFSWHQLIATPPDCLLQFEATMDKNYMGSTIDEYNKSGKQKVNVGNLDQINKVKIWRKEPSLILSLFSGTYLKGFDIQMGLINPEPRVFELDGKNVEIQITSSDRKGKKKKTSDYTKYIFNNLYDEEKRQLERSLSFKQYKKVNNDIALNDIRSLITKNDGNGVYLWDPYLRANDIFKTLFYSPTAGVNIRAIGSTNSNINKVYEKQGKEPEKIIEEEKLLFENPKNNNHGLKFEYRMQHGMNGWKFHDRFLIFPASELTRAKVYALGTSVNSFGVEHNILQEVSHPQPVVDAFNELWDELNKSECIVWKHPS
ncbi:MAG TPA: VPA1262 family N-terminal domain-containing protein [Segetibacter sp.]|jgi:hypothetical protein